VAHLLPTISHLLLQALLIDRLRGGLPLPPTLVEKLASYLLLQACLLKVCVESCLSPFLQWRGLPSGHLCNLCSLQVCVERSSLLLHPSPVEKLASCLICKFCLLKVHVKSSSLLPPPFLGSLKAPYPFCCMFIIQGFFFCTVGVSPSRVYSRGGCGSTACCLFAHLFVCITKAGLEPESGSTGALLVSQCNMVWRSLLQAGSLGCRSFAYSWCYFSAKYGSSISARFLIYGAHAVCFLPLVAIVDPPNFLFYFISDPQIFEQCVVRLLIVFVVEFYFNAL
jgi:hypothetical protein